VFLLKRKHLAIAIASLCLSGQALANAFINGNFESGNTNGWTTGTGYRASEDNSQLNPTQFLPGGSLYDSSLNHSAIVSSGIAPHTDGNLNEVYSGSYSFRAEDTTFGGYASAIQQTVVNYTDPSIFFAWAAVLEGAHGTNNAATFKLVLRDDTAGTNLIAREYNAADGGAGVDARFTLSSDGYYYTQWQIEQLDVSGFLGHDFTLSLLASDCQPTGHAGYVYLDGFGAVNPPPDPVPTPLPGTLALLGIGAMGMRLDRRKR
jgi:hypothetical protein